MKEVVFKEYRQVGALICGIFCLLGACALLCLFATNINKIDFECIFVLALFLAIGIADVIFAFYPKEGIKSIKIDDTHLFITSFDESKKEVITNILLEDILAFQFNIQCEQNYSDVPIRGNKLDITINVNIECSDEIAYKYTFHTVDYSKIKQMFGIAKYIPNFSYKVDTNSQQLQQNIVNLAKTGKNLSLREAFSAYFEDKNIPQSKKIFVKVLMFLLAIQIIIGIIVICALFIS